MNLPETALNVSPSRTIAESGKWWFRVDYLHFFSYLFFRLRKEEQIRKLNDAVHCYFRDRSGDLTNDAQAMQNYPSHAQSCTLSFWVRHTAGRWSSIDQSGERKQPKPNLLSKPSPARSQPREHENLPARRRVYFLTIAEFRGRLSWRLGARIFISRRSGTRQALDTKYSRSRKKKQPNFESGAPKDY